MMFAMGKITSPGEDAARSLDGGWKEPSEEAEAKQPVAEYGLERWNNQSIC